MKDNDIISTPVPHVMKKDLAKYMTDHKYSTLAEVTRVALRKLLYEDEQDGR